MSFTNLKYHIVFSTKSRQRALTPEVKPRLVKYMGGIVRNVKGAFFEADGPEDHIHLAIGIHPSIAVSALVRDLKSNATRWLRETFPSHREFQWQDEYAAFTVSESQLEKVLAYIRHQEEHHREMTFDEELRTLLQKHGIQFDERYLMR